MSLPIFSQILSAVAAEFAPATEHERFLVETMAEARFRLSRLNALTSITLNRLLEGAINPGHDIETSARSLNKVEQLITAAERSYYRAHRELLAAQRARLQPAVPPKAKAVATDSALLDLLLQIPERPSSAAAPPHPIDQLDEDDDALELLTRPGFQENSRKKAA